MNTNAVPFNKELQPSTSPLSIDLKVILTPPLTTSQSIFSRIPGMIVCILQEDVNDIIISPFSQQ